MSRSFRIVARGGAAAACAMVALAWVGGGCTRDSVRVAMEAQRRADDVQQTVFDRQHEALCVLLYRDLGWRLAAAGGPLDPEQETVLNDVWNDRDLVEFWALQHERARALRIAGVDAKLAADQSGVDLLVKSLAARADRVEQHLTAGVVNEELGDLLRR